MKRWMMTLALLMLGCGAGMTESASAQTEAGKVPEGVWQGKLDAAGQTVTIIFTITRGADGKLAGTLDVPEQGAKGVPLSDVRMENGSLRVELKAAGLVFTGKPGKNG